MTRVPGFRSLGKLMPSSTAPGQRISGCTDLQPRDAKAKCAFLLQSAVDVNGSAAPLECSLRASYQPFFALLSACHPRHMQATCHLIGRVYRGILWKVHSSSRARLFCSSWTQREPLAAMYKNASRRSQDAGRKLGVACLCLVGILLYITATMKFQSVPVGLAALSALWTGCGAAPTTTIDAAPIAGSSTSDLFPPTGSE